METPTHQQIRAWLEREIALGLEAVPRSVAAAVAAPAAASAAGRADPAPAARVAPSADRAASSMPPGSAPAASALSALLVEPAILAADSLPALREVLGDCRRCKLCQGRTNIVFGVGNPRARIMFVGEGPGADEDLKGEPFVGAAGELLTKIITNGMGLARADVYIANVVKCRPPNNRDPEPDEIVACEPFLRRQIELVNPDVIVSLGRLSTQALLGSRIPISRARGRWHEYRGRPLMPTFHPAYLLRAPGDKGLVWADIKLVMERLDLPLPPPKGVRGS